MQWEQLTALDFARAVATCQGVGVIPIGVIEAHGPHLPLGTDMMTAHWRACRAAEQEPVLVYPPFPYSINSEASHLPGAIVVPRELAFALLETICDEMARNGVTRIILLSGHGGNRHFLPLFVQTLPEKRKRYVVYYADLPSRPDPDGVLETGETGHACESETSAMLHIHPELVRMDQAPPRPFPSLARNRELAAAGAYMQADWYSQYPHMVVGDPRLATAAKGQALLAGAVQLLVELIRAVKADTVSPALVQQYNDRSRQPRPPAFWTDAAA